MTSVSGDALGLMTETLGGGGFASVLAAVASCSGQWQVAEEEIERAKRGKSPEVRAELEGSFRLLMPIPAVSELGNERLYRAHCRELLGRVEETVGWSAGRRRRELDRATNAEVAVVVMNSSLKAPPSARLARVYALAFAEVFPEQRNLAEDLPAEDFPGADDELRYDVTLGVARITNGRGLPDAGCPRALRELEGGAP